MRHHRPFFGTGKNHNPYFVVTDQIIRKLREIIERPDAACVTCARKQADEKLARLRFLFFQQRLNRKIRRGARLQHRRSWWILNAEWLEQIEVAIDEVRFFYFPGRAWFEVGEKVERTIFP